MELKQNIKPKVNHRYGLSAPINDHSTCNSTDKKAYYPLRILSENSNYKVLILK
jgi:hypothetical protein